MFKLLWHLTVLSALSTVSFDSSARSLDEDCAAPPVVKNSSLTLVGELHGTSETPDWVANVACALSRRHEVIVALEMSRAEQGHLESYLSSAGTDEDQSALIAGPFWSGTDGRASDAIVVRIERVRLLSKRGARITVAAIDQWNAPTSRDAAMAEAIRKLRTQKPHAKILALLGNYHARTAPRSEPATAYDQPVGYLLRDLAPLAVLATFNGGEAWICAPEYGPSAATSGSRPPREPGFYLGEAPLPGYSAVVNLGQATPSMPVSNRGE